MKHFALFFHLTRTLTPEETRQRGIEIAAWVDQVRAMGITLDPRTLKETDANLSMVGNEIVSREGPSDSTLATILFLDAPDAAQAVSVARKHPGLRYGARVEVREWATPPPLAAK